MEKVICKKLNTLEPIFYYKLKKECLDLGEKLKWNDGLNQIMLQTNDPDIDDFMTGAGKLSGNVDTNEKNYKYIIPSLKGSMIEQFISSMNGFRSRLMYMKPKSCYSIHPDPTGRIHLALQTNNQAYFLFPEQSKFFQIPEDRTVYYFDTRNKHSFMNGSDQARIHLVMCTDIEY